MKTHPADSTSVPGADWKWFGFAGHFCSRNDCLFHLTTQVGRYLVSTVGAYLPRHLDRTAFTTVGDGRLYETMVFECSGECPCGCGMPDHSGSEIESAGYNDPVSARKGHYALCEWAASLSSPSGLCYNPGNEQVPDTGVPAGQGPRPEVSQDREGERADRERSLEACRFELDRARKLIRELSTELARPNPHYYQELRASVHRLLQGLPEK